MAEEKSIEPVVHEAPASASADQGAQPLLPGNPKCYENLLGLLSHPDYIRNIKFNFDDPFDAKTNSLRIVVSKYEGVSEQGEATWGEDAFFEFNEGHGVREGQRFVRCTPLGISESFPHPLGNFNYQAALNEEAEKKRSQKKLLKDSKTEVTFSDRPISAETTAPSGRSIYWDEVMDFYQNVEKLKFATLSHPDVLQKIKYAKESLPLNDTNLIIAAAIERRKGLQDNLADKLNTLKETTESKKKLKALTEEAERKCTEAMSKVYLELFKKFSEKANHRLRPQQEPIDPKKLPPAMLVDGQHVFEGRRLQVVVKKELYLLDKPGLFKMVTDHKLFKEFGKLDKTAAANAKQKKSKRDYAAGGSSENKKEEAKKPWDYFIEQPNSCDPELRKNLKAAKDAGLTYQPLTVTRMVPKHKAGGGMTLVSEYINWNPRQRQPEQSLSPGAFGIPMIRTVMGFNAGPKIPYRMSIEIGGFQYITDSSVFKKKQESLMSGEVSNQYLDAWDSGSVGSMFLAPPPTVLSLEAPSIHTHDHDESEDQPRQKRIKAAEAELQECSADLAQDLEEID